MITVEDNLGSLHPIGNQIITLRDEFNDIMLLDRDTAVDLYQKLGRLLFPVSPDPLPPPGMIELAGGWFNDK